MTSALDSSNRPLVVPTANGPYMAIGVKEGIAAQGGPVGSVLGLPVYVDATMPINLGAGVNEDRIVVADFSDAWLMEGQLRTRVLPDVLSGNLTVVDPDRSSSSRKLAFDAPPKFSTSPRPVITNHLSDGTLSKTCEAPGPMFTDTSVIATRFSASYIVKMI